MYNKFKNMDVTELMDYRYSLICKTNQLLATIGLELIVRADDEDIPHPQFHYYFEIGYHALLPQQWKDDNPGDTYIQEEVYDRNDCMVNKGIEVYSPELFFFWGIEFLKKTSKTFATDYNEAIKFHKSSQN
tara:strand:- start:3321 stop:3713 length:393 start_codon:yes stop_codon:yes gene_type:complete